MRAAIYFMPQLSVQRVALALALGMLMALVILHAAVTEDAYISFRVVDNFVHGFGLRWNIHERVQVYTNPLWTLLHIPFYALWENIFFITIGLSLACTFGALWLAMRTAGKSWLLTVALLIIPLAVSTTFIDHSTSGLENPLSHLLFAWFGWSLLRAGKDRYWFWISLPCALALTNRLDTVLLYFPVLAYLVVTHFKTVHWRQCLLGALPIIAWELFSLFYYGFLFPNTKYAKLDTGISAMAYLRHGLAYFYNLAALDITSALWLVAAAIALPISWLCLPRLRQHVSGKKIALALGILLYSLYVIKVGGNQVSGRFWSLPVFASVWLLYVVAPGTIKNIHAVVLIALLVAVRLAYPDIATLKKSCRPCFRGFIAPVSYQLDLFPGRWLLMRPASRPLHSVCAHCFITRDGRVDLWRSRNGFKPLPPYENVPPRMNVYLVGVGMFGYRYGPQRIIIDQMALSSPLMSRLPSVNRRIGVIGHLPRRVPKGYPYAIKTGSLEKMDPDLAEYYSALRFIVAGDLWSVGRWVEIIKFNAGYYDGAKKRYLAKSRARQAMSWRQNPSGQSTA